MSVCNAILFPDMCRLHTSTVGKLEGSTFTFYNQHGMHRRPGLRGQHTAHSIFTTSTAGAILLACRASTERPAFLQPAQHAPSSWPLGRPAGSALPFYNQNSTRRALVLGRGGPPADPPTRTFRDPRFRKNSCFFGSGAPARGVHTRGVNRSTLFRRTLRPARRRGRPKKVDFFTELGWQI